MTLRVNRGPATATTVASGGDRRSYMVMARTRMMRTAIRTPCTAAELVMSGPTAVTKAFTKVMKPAEIVMKAF
jgi:hypothetical protein